MLILSKIKFHSEKLGPRSFARYFGLAESKGERLSNDAAISIRMLARGEGNRAA